MFDTVRNNSKIMMGLLFILIIPSFVLVGIEGYSRFNEQGTAVAKVDGEKITQQQWDAAHQRESERIRAQRPGIDAKLLDSPQARQATLERLVNDRVVSAAAKAQRLITSDARLARELQQDPAIAALRGSDGRLDMDRYRQLVGSQGMSPEMFEANVRADLSNRQVLQGLLGSTLVTQSQRRRQQSQAADQGRLPPHEPAELEPGRALHRRQKAFHHHPLARHGRGVALPCRRRRRACSWSSASTTSHQKELGEPTFAPDRHPAIDPAKAAWPCD